MARFDIPPEQWPRLLGAALAGWVWTLAFPRWDFVGAAWATPALLLGVAWGQRGGAAFRTGYVAGLVHALTAHSWLLQIPFLPGAILGWLALAAYLALYPAAWVWLSWHLLPVRQAPVFLPQAYYTAAMVGVSRTAAMVSRSCTGVGAFAPPGPRLGMLDPLMGLRWGQRLVWTVSVAAAWAGLETIRGWFLSGFPWNPLGASLHEVLPLAQLAALTGVAGLSFLLVWTGLAFACALLAIVRAPRRRTVWLGEAGLPLVVLLGVTLWGAHEMTRPYPTRGELRAALVQPSIPQRLIWDAAESTNRFRKLIELSQLALATEPDLLVWPEAAVPNLLRYDPGNFAAITNLLAGHRAWMILGADDAEPRREEPGEADYYNSSFLLSPDGRVRGSYRKQHLVPFGEFIPFARWAPFLKRLIPIGEGFQAGEGPGHFDLAEPPASAAILICFEDVFAAVTRRSAAQGPDFLLNLTNNGWFGESAAQWQHAACAVFRAIENRLPLVRCTNNGLTCWIDAVGRKREVFQDEGRDIYGPGFQSVRLPLPDRTQPRSRTLYQAMGDWFGWGCAGALVLMTGLVVVRRQPVAP